MIKLFCLPYAGGSATIYYKYKRLLDNGIELRPIELAGRGKLIKQEPYESLDEAVDDIYRRIEPELNLIPFAFLGHSLGTLLAYKLIIKIQGEKKLYPVHTFLSAGRAPHMIAKVKQLHNLPDELFEKEIIKMGGTDSIVFENKDLAKYFIKILKADFKMIETYHYIPDYKKINSDITLFLGKKDSINPFDILEWKNYTDNSCTHYVFSDDHFFINSKAEEVAKVINKTLLNKGYFF